jgi:hypothetical protein
MEEEIMDLSLVHTSVLYNEIASRFDACVFGGIKQTDMEHEVFYNRQSGSNFGCMGICDMLKDEIIENFMSSSEIGNE